MKEKTTKISLLPVKVLTPNGFAHGLLTKRPVDTREAKHILKNVFGIDLNTRDCFYDKEEYDSYNSELTGAVNDWLNGEIDDQAIMVYAYDYSDEPLGIFNAFKLAEYLQKRGVI